MRRANAIAGFLLAVFGAVMMTLVIPWQIDTAPPGMMSPRLVPTLMMAVLTALAVLLFLTNLPRSPGRPEPAPISRAELVALFKIILVFGFSIALYQLISPLAAGAGLVVGTLIALGERRPLVILAIPAFLLLGIWFVFYRILGTAIL